MSPTLLDLREVRSFLRRKLLVSVETEESLLALTFDDGPDPRNTPRLLDLLDGKGIPATFFLLGRNARRHPDLVRRMWDEGHEIGNHGYYHIPMTLLPDPLLIRHVKATGEVIAGLTGFYPRFLRPPLGWFSSRVLLAVEDLGYQPVIGNIHPRDSARPGAGVIVTRVLDRADKGSIVILHDGGQWPKNDRRQTIEAVDRITDVLGEKGYGFVRLSDLASLEIKSVWKRKTRAR